MLPYVWRYVEAALLADVAHIHQGPASYLLPCRFTTSALGDIFRLPSFVPDNKSLLYLMH